MKLIPIGFVGKPHGLKGAFFLRTPQTKRSDFSYEKIYLTLKAQTLEFEVVESYESGENRVIRLKEIKNREELDQWKNAQISIKEEDLMDHKEDDEYLVHELLNLNVYNQSKLIGKIVGVTNFGAQENLKIELEENKKIFFFPFLSAFIEKLDTENKEIHIINYEDFI